MIKYFIDKDQIYDFHMSYIDGTDYFKKQMQFTGRAFLIRIPIYFFIFLFFFGIGPALFFFTILIILYIRRYNSCINFVKRDFKKLLSKSYLKHLTEDTTVKIEDSGLHVTTSVTDKIYKWHSIKSLNIIDNYIFIETYSYNEKLLIPSLAFASEAKKTDFLNKISQNTNIEIRTAYPEKILYKQFT